MIEAAQKRSLFYEQTGTGSYSGDTSGAVWKRKARDERNRCRGVPTHGRELGGYSSTTRPTTDAPEMDAVVSSPALDSRHYRCGLDILCRLAPASKLVGSTCWKCSLFARVVHPNICYTETASYEARREI